jgi:hypothetical protein
LFEQLSQLFPHILIEVVFLAEFVSQAVSCVTFIYDNPLDWHPLTQIHIHIEQRLIVSGTFQGTLVSAGFLLLKLVLLRFIPIMVCYFFIMVCSFFFFLATIVLMVHLLIFLTLF